MISLGKSGVPDTSTFGVMKPSTQLNKDRNLILFDFHKIFLD